MAELFPFQQEAVAQLMAGKKVLILDVGCLAKGTPVRLANGRVKPVEKLNPGDELLSFDEETEELVPNAIEKIVRHCDQPKPMIELSYDGERITTTYDHYFYTKDGYTPLYQLVWGALEASQRVQLQLLCEQYGQDCDDKLFWRKRSWNNEASQEQQVGSSKDGNGREKCFSPSSYRGDLVEKPIKLTVCKPHQFKSARQQGGKPRVLLKEIQCVSWIPQGECQKTDAKEQQSINKRRAERDKRLLRKVYAGDHEQPRKSKTLQKIIRKIPHSGAPTNTKVRNWSVKIKVPAPYYTIVMRQAPYTYCIGRKHNYLTHNCGKTACAMVWAEQKCRETGKNKVLVVTTASKAKARTVEGLNDFEDDALKFCSSSFSKSLSSSLSLISWHKLRAWVDANWSSLDEWVIIYDELHYAKNGVSSGRGKAFLKIAKKNQDWIGMTATPGDGWESYCAYFTACNLVRNKTSFMAEFANVQTYKGYPEIVSWRNEAKLEAMWKKISFAPDARRATQEMPESINRPTYFSLPKTYATVLKTRMRAGSDGDSMDDFLDTPGALTSELRRICFTKDKQEWVSDFISGLGTQAIVFYNFVDTGDKLEEIITKALPEGARIWRIDGKHHEIPTKETLGPHDIVLSQWQSGSEGLNLQAIHYELLVELPYSYSVLRQGMGRIKRIGQTQTMFFYSLLCNKGIEQDIKTILKTKGEFAAKEWCLGKGIELKGE